MPRDVTVTFDDNSTHIYNNVPDNVTPDQVTARAGKDFSGRRVTALDGGEGKGGGAAREDLLEAPKTIGKGVWRGIQAAEPADVAQVRGERTGPGLLDFKITPKPETQQPQPKDRGALADISEFAGTLMGGGPGAAGKVGSAAVAAGKPLLRVLGSGQATKGATAMATARRALAGAEQGSQTFAGARAADKAAQAAKAASAPPRGGKVGVDDAAALFWALMEHHVGRAIAYSAIKRALGAATKNPQTLKFLTTRAAQMGAKVEDAYANVPSTDPGDQPSMLSEMKGDMR